MSANILCISKRWNGRRYEIRSKWFNHRGTSISCIQWSYPGHAMAMQPTYWAKVMEKLVINLHKRRKLFTEFFFFFFYFHLAFSLSILSLILDTEMNISRVGTPKKSDSCGSLYLTECILTLTTALPKNVQTNPHFTAFLWQKFCPTLAAALGSPGRVNLDKKFTYKWVVPIWNSIVCRQIM